MLVRGLIAVAVVMAFASVPDTARADSWGCSYDKCTAACAKAGGKYCITYCERRLADKRRDKTCK
ncbi:hypothetical protein CSIRO_3196 [Bradyrhizobiaceae bacterium SG-6C]|nr:hypothetical protein CSIRO_3196 [Bradyrhizobiaceae bacterium SG-6C]